MSKALAERFALENGVDVDEIIDFFRGLDKEVEDA